METGSVEYIQLHVSATGASLAEFGSYSYRPKRANDPPQMPGEPRNVHRRADCQREYKWRAAPDATTSRHKAHYSFSRGIVAKKSLDGCTAVCGGPLCGQDRYLLHGSPVCHTGRLCGSLRGGTSGDLGRPASSLCCGPCAGSRMALPGWHTTLTIRHMAVPLGLVALIWLRLYLQLARADLPQSPQNHVGGRN